MQQTRFLCKNWFPEHNPAALRRSLMRELLQLLVEQAPRSSLPEARRGAALDAACDLMRQLDNLDRHVRAYAPPVSVPVPAALEAPPSPPAVEPRYAAESAAAGAHAAPAPALLQEADVVLDVSAMSDSGDVEVAGGSGLETDAAEAGGADVVEPQPEDGVEAVEAVVVEPSGDEALGLEAAIMALEGPPAPGVGSGDAVSGYSGEADEVSVLDLWHPDDLWQ